MQTDLSLNNHRLLGSSHLIQGHLDQKKGGNKFMLNGFDKIIIPKNTRVSSVVAFYHNSKASYQNIALKITNYSFEKGGTPGTSIIEYSPPQTTQLQTIKTNLMLLFGYISVDFYALHNVVKDQEISLFIEYKAP